MPPVSPDTRSYNQHIENKKNYETSQFSHGQYNTVDITQKVDIEKIIENNIEKSEIENKSNTNKQIISKSTGNENKNDIIEDLNKQIHPNKNKAIKKEKVDYNINAQLKVETLAENEKLKNLEEESLKIKKIYDKDNIELIMDEDLKNEENEYIKSLPRVILKNNFISITENLLGINKMYQSVIENKFLEIFINENPEKSNSNNDSIGINIDDFIK